MIERVDERIEGSDLLVVVLRTIPVAIGDVTRHPSGLVEHSGRGYEMRRETLIAYRGTSPERQGRIAAAWRGAQAEQARRGL